MAFVVAFVDDLMFLSRIREAARPLGVEVRSVRGPADLLEACRQAPRAVFVDLETRRLPLAEALAALRSEPELAAVEVVGFYGHVRAEVARSAAAAACTRVFARGAFVRELPSLLEPAASPPS